MLYKFRLLLVVVTAGSLLSACSATNPREQFSYSHTPHSSYSNTAQATHIETIADY